MLSTKMRSLNASHPIPQQPWCSLMNVGRLSKERKIQQRNNPKRIGLSIETIVRYRQIKAKSVVSPHLSSRPPCTPAPSNHPIASFGSKRPQHLMAEYTFLYPLCALCSPRPRSRRGLRPIDIRPPRLRPHPLLLLPLPPCLPLRRRPLLRLALCAAFSWVARYQLRPSPHLRLRS